MSIQPPQVATHHCSHRQVKESPMTEKTRQTNSFLDNVNAMYAKVVVLCNLPGGVSEKIRVCNSTFVTRFGVRLRDWLYTFEGWRSVYSKHTNPSKGGLRFSADSITCLSGSTEPRHRSLLKSHLSTLSKYRGRDAHQILSERDNVIAIRLNHV